MGSPSLRYQIAAATGAELSNLPLEAPLELAGAWELRHQRVMTQASLQPARGGGLLGEEQASRGFEEDRIARP